MRRGRLLGAARGHVRGLNRCACTTFALDQFQQPAEEASCRLSRSGAVTGGGKMNAKQLLADHSIFEQMADCAPAMFWRAGLDGGYLWFNRAWFDFTGRSFEQELGDGWAEGVHSQDRARRLSIYEAAFAARQRFAMQYRLRRHDGQYRWIWDQGAPFLKDGAFAGFLGCCTDVTEQREMRDRHALLLQGLSRQALGVMDLVLEVAQAMRLSQQPFPALMAYLEALSAIYRVLSSQHWSGCSMTDALQATLPFVPPHARNRIILAGLDQWLSPVQATTIALCLLEFCLESAANGALAHREGAVAITWREESGIWQVTAQECCGAARLIPSMPLLLRLTSGPAADATLEEAPGGLRLILGLLSPLAGVDFAPRTA